MAVRGAIAGLAIACLLGAPCAARADTVELTSGRRIVGTITNTTATGVVIDVGGREMRIRQQDVQSITFETSRPIPVAAPAPIAPPAPTASPSAPSPSEGASPPPTTALAPPLPTRIAGALAALERLQAATVIALAPADYTERVEDVRREVAPALGDTSDQVDVHKAIGAAVRYHAFAALAGAVYETRGDLAAIGRDPVIAECRLLTELVARDAEQLRLNPSDPAVVGLVAATEGAPALRACAGEQIAEAERRARAPR